MLQTSVFDCFLTCDFVIFFSIFGISFVTNPCCLFAISQHNNPTDARVLLLKQQSQQQKNKKRNKQGRKAANDCKGKNNRKNNNNNNHNAGCKLIIDLGRSNGKEAKKERNPCPDRITDESQIPMTNETRKERNTFEKYLEQKEKDYQPSFIGPSGKAKYFFSTCLFFFAIFCFWCLVCSCFCLLLFSVSVVVVLITILSLLLVFFFRITIYCPNQNKI